MYVYNLRGVPIRLRSQFLLGLHTKGKILWCHADENEMQNQVHLNVTSLA